MVSVLTRRHSWSLLCLCISELPANKKCNARPSDESGSPVKNHRLPMTAESRAGASDLVGLIDAPENRAVTCHWLRHKQPIHAMLMQRTTVLAMYIASNSTAHTAATCKMARHLDPSWKMIRNFYLSFCVFSH